jgi:hypothetical protein
MKPIQLLIAASLALTGAAAFAAAPKSETYTVIGYYADAKPSPGQFAEATAAVAKKVAGMTQVTQREEADHRVEVLFAKGKFQIYVDALPLRPGYIKLAYPAPTGGSMERAEIDRSQPR